MPQTTIESLLDQFISELDKSPSTIRAYRTDIQQCITWLHANDITVVGAQHVTSSHIDDYLRYLTDQGRIGTTCSRKLISIHVFFTYLVSKGVIQFSPTAKVKKPRKERKPKYALRPDEFKRIVGAARGNPRDFALLQLLFQAGIRVSEVIAIRIPELDLEHKTLIIHIKGSRERLIPLEKKTLHALQSYYTVRPMTPDQHLFLNYQGHSLSIGGVRKMVEKYAKRAGITKKISCHSLFYSCASARSAIEINAFILRETSKPKFASMSKKYLPIDTEKLRKLMEFTSL